MKDFRLPFDDGAYHAINGLGLDWLDSVFVAVSSPLFGISVAAVMLVWTATALKAQAFRPVAQVAAALLITDRFGVVLKDWFGRIRPCYALPPGTFRQLTPIAHSGSLPSLHSANSFAFALALGLCVPSTLRYTLPLAALIALSRVGVGVHWPSDIVLGALYGGLVGALVNGVGKRLSPQPVARAPPGRG